MQRRDSHCGRAVALGALLGASALACRTPAAGDGAESEPLAFVGARVLVDPWSAPIEDGVVVVRGGLIETVGRRETTTLPPGMRRIDCAGTTLTAGFRNSHVHLFGHEWAGASVRDGEELQAQLAAIFLRYGFTQVFDTGSDAANTLALRARIESGELAGPAIATTGAAIVSPEAMPPPAALEAFGIAPFAAPEVTDAASAASAARALIAAGVDGIKVHLQPPRSEARRMSPEAVRAAVEVARGAGKPSFVHPHEGADVALALDAGATIVAHTTPRSGPWEAGVLERVRPSSSALVATLTLWEETRGDRVVDVALAQLRAWRDAGGTVLFGTDHGAVSAGPGTEYALMARAGLSPSEILASLTTAPATVLGPPGCTGRVAPGEAADLVVLDADPLIDPVHLTRVRFTVRAGAVVYAMPTGSAEP